MTEVRWEQLPPKWESWSSSQEGERQERRGGCSSPPQKERRGEGKEMWEGKGQLGSVMPGTSSCKYCLEHLAFCRGKLYFVLICSSLWLLVPGSFSV